MLAAARTLLKNRHIEDVTIPHIATTAGVAVGTFYLYFKSKTELLDALSMQFRADMVAAAEPILKDPRPLRELLESLFEQIQEVATNYREILHLLGGEALYYTDHADGRAHIEHIRTRIEQEQVAGLVSPTLHPAIAADLIDSLLGRMVRGHLRSTSPQEIEAYYHQTLSLIYYLLKP
ncbi:MAG: hypothetical protein GFH27_549279n411 [Chloroflexi bacterium AL-W]|nr:hypothetical protein [Chloroflexi bacterium AL-N1]NOK65377.1 hypothetical protein [Chloroflexi bacterium AL-N10]NOK72357.1 hypothetical protein [Chloroflexi bacterium AL-N5]NOK79556.1 hypothetical protein [Chloroflexi bacterium AL-W]NOK87472.1 hypothetical protein [Chloroflexi bacterium AL-N15]